MSSLRHHLGLSTVVFYWGPPVSGCGWSATAALEPGRLRGDWMADNNGSVAWSGRFDLSL